MQHTDSESERRRSVVSTQFFSAQFFSSLDHNLQLNLKTPANIQIKVVWMA